MLYRYDEIVRLLRNIISTLKDRSSSFWEIFFSAFLGFGFALLVEAIVSAVNSHQAKQQLLQALLTELKEVKETADCLEKEKYYFEPYKIPIWKGACESGSIISLSKMKNYTELLSVFSQIEESNEIEKDCLFFSGLEGIVNAQPGSTTAAIKEVSIDSRERIKEQVQKGLRILKRETKNGRKE